MRWVHGIKIRFIREEGDRYNKINSFSINSRTMTQFTLNLETITLSDEQFFQLCQNSPDLRFERNANGELVIMSPTGGETSHCNAG